MVIIIASVAIYGFSLLSHGSTPQTPSTDSTPQETTNIQTPTTTVAPGSGGTQTSAESSFSLPISGGGVIKTQDFLNNQATTKDPLNAGYYYLGYHLNEGVPDSTASKNPPYVIEYIEATHYFNIGLLQEPVKASRQQAEQYLMSTLGVSQAQMCQLNYMVAVPYSINQAYAGTSLGFSFCPGAVTLP